MEQVKSGLSIALKLQFCTAQNNPEQAQPVLISPIPGDLTLIA
jgi:hypothetical protein